MWLSMPASMRCNSAIKIPAKSNLATVGLSTGESGLPVNGLIRSGERQKDEITCFLLSKDKLRPRGCRAGSGSAAMEGLGWKG